ncbi:HPr family phosphocarrier protein [Cellulomonas sp. SLBN-39]|uniref:HPr family phosphocarrier protein n=1 Tax=Cellulomonas sp. SLBN-39 TaxID=2768446 RepID=UPI001153AA4F|nr:HPr family phosphocarrier protein [Cellulomonas sp. SLBN-39]TQL03100.1 phosphocarrier protein HPr [Cellulomonas sp. SLBN-39]
MLERRVIIASASGLHARPASRFTQAAADCGHPVTVSRPGQPGVDASSVLMVMSQGLGHGEEVVLASDDAAAGPALDALVTLLEQDLDAQE